MLEFQRLCGSGKIQDILCYINRAMDATSKLYKKKYKFHFYKKKSHEVYCSQNISYISHFFYMLSTSDTRQIKYYQSQ